MTSLESHLSEVPFKRLIPGPGGELTTRTNHLLNAMCETHNAKCSPQVSCSFSQEPLQILGALVPVETGMQRPRGKAIRGRGHLNAT